MSSAPNPLADAPTIAGEIILLPVDEIKVGERLRPIDLAWAEALGRVMVREGQQVPIEVCRVPQIDGDDQPWLLVAGAHRLTGAQLVGIELIEAREVSSSDQHRRQREVSENLWRRGLDPIDRAAFIAEQVTLLKLRAGIDPSKDGRKVSAEARWQKAVKDEAADANVTMTIAYGWADDIAEQLGFSRATVERDLMLYRRLAPSVIARLRAARHPVATNATQLRALAKLDYLTQTLAIDALLGGNGDRKFADAIAFAKGAARPVADPAEKRLSAFIGAFARMSLAERKGALAQLAAQLPAGFSITDPNGETLA